MSLPRKRCKKCDNPVWAKGLCKDHIEKKPLPQRNMIFYSDVEGVKKFREIMDKTVKNYKFPIHKKKTATTERGTRKSEKRYKLFYEIWYSRGAKSEVSGSRIYGEPSSANFHHIIPKGKYPEGDLDEDNIIILTMDEHADVENDMYIFDEVNRRRELLLIKYNLI